MPIKGSDFFTQLRTASITAELKLQAELCQSDKTVFIFRLLSGTKQICTRGPATFNQWRDAGI